MNNIQHEINTKIENIEKYIEMENMHVSDFDFISNLKFTWVEHSQKFIDKIYGDIEVSVFEGVIT